MIGQSPLSTHHSGSLWGRGGDGMDYRHSSSRPGTSVDSSENRGSTMSMGCVCNRQIDYGHVLIPLYRSTIPLMQHAGVHVPPLDTPMHGPYATTRSIHAYGARNGQGGSGPSQPLLSRLPEM